MRSPRSGGSTWASEAVRSPPRPARTMMKEQGKFGKRINVTFVNTQEGVTVGPPNPAVQYTKRIDAEMMAEVFGIKPITDPEWVEPGPETKWLVVGPQASSGRGGFVGIISNELIKDTFGFDFRFQYYDDPLTRDCDANPDCGIFGIIGSNGIYDYVPKSTVFTDDYVRIPSPLAARSTPYVLEEECPTCSRSKCSGCLNIYNCQQARCFWQTTGEGEGSCSNRRFGSDSDSGSDSGSGHSHGPSFRSDPGRGRENHD